MRQILIAARQILIAAHHILIAAVVCGLLAACGPSALDNRETADRNDDAGAKKAEAEPTDIALARPGNVGDGETIVTVNGRTITPAGALNEVRQWPIDAWLLPDGNLVVSALRTEGFSILDAATLEPVADLNQGNVFHGLVGNAAGDRLWISGGAGQAVYEYEIVGGAPVLMREIASQLFPAGLALTPDEEKLLVCNSFGSGVQIFDLASGEAEDIAPTNLYPYDIVVSPDGEEAYVSNWGDSSVTIIDIDHATRLADVAVGLHPEGLALSPDGSLLYVANADDDSISVVDVAGRAEIDVWDVYRTEEMVGATPVDLALSGDGATLYAAASGLYAVLVYDTADGELSGMIPTGYYPSSVTLDEANGLLYITNGKGGGEPSATPGWGVSRQGLVQQVPLPTPAELAEYTQAVEDNLTRTSLFWETLEIDSPIPTERGVPSAQIKRVIYIMKENKTYDQVFGDLEGTEADPTHLTYGEDYTPNAHRLARAFTSCDNYYSEADVSIQGHMWSVNMYANDYMEKAWAIDSGHRYPLVNIEPAVTSRSGSIFRHLHENGITFRVYGQVLSMGDIDELTPFVNLKYGFWNLGVSDETKAGEIIREMEAGIWPQFLYISLPNDHTEGTDAGAPSMDYYVGDNDAALGKLIDYVTHSDYWAETLIIVTEDDPQSGSDHVDKHRTIALIISPYAKRGYTSSVLYSMPSIWTTIEMIFGLPPMSLYEEHASPMYDCFTTAADLTAYDAVPNPTPLTYNPADLPMADYCAQADWGAPDQVRRLGEVVWAVKHPGEPWPGDDSVAGYGEEEEEEEEGEMDAEHYRAAVAAIQQHARATGLWNGETLPTIKQLVDEGKLRVAE